MRKESTTSIMRRGFISTLAMCAAMLMSCSSESDIITNGGGEDNEPGALGKGVYCTVENQELVNSDAEGRSTLSYGTRGMEFAWAANDKLTIYPSESDAIYAIYNLSDNRGSSLNAFFTADGFDLTQGKVYYALSKEQNNQDGLTPSGCNFASKRNIMFTYDGQRQTANDNTNHLGRYDFMAASGECTADNLVSLHFKHLGPTLRVIIQAPEDGDEATEFKGKYFTEMTIYSSDNTFRQPDRYIDLTKGLQLDNTYSPKWNDIDRTTDDYINAKPFTLKLGEEPALGNPEVGFQPNAKGNIIAYMMIPPENFTGKSIVFTLKASDGTEYFSTFSSGDLDLDPSKAYQMVTRARKSTQFNVTLKINHLWQHGDEEETSRATGDPGYDKDNTLPTHIYYIFCVDGKVKKVGLNAVNKITGIPATHWSSTSRIINEGKNIEVISTYKGAGENYQFTFSVAEDETDVTKNVYFVASTADISSSFSGIVENTLESEVQALTYAIQGATQEASQTFLSGLYSTPFVSNETFVGHLSGVVKDIFLYHVAAKVDLKWNCATGMAVTPTPDKIKVTGVQSANLSMFMPTQNGKRIMKDEVQIADFTSLTTKDVSTDVTWGTFMNGRQVYYLPQFSDNKYNVTIGPVNYTDGVKYEFNDVSTDGGFTSWYRALIRQ